MTPDRAKFNKEVEKGLLDRGVNMDIRPMTQQEYLEHRVKILETLMQHKENEITGLKAHAEALNSECNELMLAVQGALPWMILLGNYIGNGTKEDPMGRCNAILAMRDALGREDDDDGNP
jgi:hypothetical protein